MAQLAVAVGGAVIGSFFGMPQLGFMAGSLVGGLLFSSGTSTTQEGPRLSDLSVSSSTFGQSIPLLYGAARLNTNIIWSSGIKETKTSTTKKQGKGAQSAKQTTVTYTYSVSFAAAVCQGPTDSLLRIWADGKVIYDATSVGGATSTDKFKLRFYKGTEDQLPDALIEQMVGAGNTPAYRGLCYIMFEDMQLADFGNRIPQLSVEVATSTVFTNSLIKSKQGSSSKFQLSNFAGRAIDYTQRRLYIQASSSSTGDPDKNGMMVFDLDTLNRVKEVTWRDVFAPSWIDSPSPFDYTGCAQGGDIFIGTVNNRIWSVDSNTFKKKLSFGDGSTRLYVSNLGMSGYGWAGGMQTLTFSGETYILATQILGNYGVIGAKSMQILYGQEQIRIGSTWYNNTAYIPMPLRASGSATYWIPGKTGDGYGEAYLINFDPVNSSNLYIYKLVIGRGSSYNDDNMTGYGVSLQGPHVVDVSGYKTGSYLAPNWIYGDYDETDNCLLFMTHNVSSQIGYFKYDFFNDEVVWNRFDDYVALGALFSFGTSRCLNSKVSGDKWGVGLQNVRVLDTRNGDYVYKNDTVLGDLGVSSPYWQQKWTSWDSDTQSLIGSTEVTLFGVVPDDNKIIRVYPARPAGREVPLADIVTDLCLRSGLTAGQVDTSGLTGTSRGYVIARPTTARAALEQICSAYFVEPTESDYKLKFRNKGAATVATIPQQWIGSIEDSGEEGDSFWKQTRTQELELPRRVSVVHWDPLIDYQQGTQMEQRISLPQPTVRAEADSTMEYPLVMTPDEAKQLAQKLLYTAWVERDKFSTKLPWRYIDLDPGDTVTVNLNDGSSYTVRITKASIGADYVMEAEFISEYPASYVSTATGTPTTDGFPQQIIPVLDNARLFFLDIPLLRDADDTAGTGLFLYYGGGVYRDGWPGGSLEMSSDGTSYVGIDSILADTDWGTTLNALPAPTNYWSTDTENTLTVVMGSAASPLSSTTRTGLFGGANAALLGQEIIQYQTVVTNPDGSYTLSGLLRGRRGTEWATTGHVAGELFIPLNIDAISGKSLELSLLNQEKLWRLVTFGRYGDSATAEPHTITGAAEKPYSPVRFRRATAGSDLAVSWLRRTRIGGALQDGTGFVPLGEAAESYEAYVLASAYDPATFDPTNPATYVRKFSSLTSPGFTYTSAQMAADSFTPSTGTLHVVAYQLSSIVGRGFPGTASLAP